MSDEAADHPWLCADQTVPAPVTVASTATDVDTCRVPRAGHAGQRTFFTLPPVSRSVPPGRIFGLEPDARAAADHDNRLAAIHSGAG
jgi:hypothetical protein